MTQNPARRGWSVALGGLAIGIACLAFMAVASPARAQGKSHGKGGGVASTRLLRGVNLTPLQAFIPGGQSDFDNQREVQSACRMHADVVRVFVMWYLLEPSRGQVDADYVAKLDSLMSQASACGAKVMFMLAATPPWDSSAPITTGFPQSGTYPARDGEFRWMVAWILRAWPGLQSIEVWNEPNYFQYWSGTPADYAGMVNEAVAAKREVGSSTLILAGALAIGDPSYNYLNQLYAAGMSGQDGISVHPYSMYCSSACRLTDPTPAKAPFRAGITRIHRLMAAHGDRGGVWLTEFGFASCPAVPTCVSEAQQARWLAKSLQIAACYRYVKGLTPFTIRDILGDPRYSQVFDAHFGLLHTDFSRKPAYSSVRSIYRRYDVAERSATGSRAKRKAASHIGLPGSRICQSILGTAAARRANAR
jgi:polysaccharide biosynthesis protein PslG